MFEWVSGSFRRVLGVSQGCSSRGVQGSFRGVSTVFWDAPGGCTGVPGYFRSVPREFKAYQLV